MDISRYTVPLTMAAVITWLAGIALDKDIIITAAIVLTSTAAVSAIQNYMKRR